jgi:hypothetical protein
MASNNDNKPVLKLSSRVKELLDLETRYTAGGFDPMPYFFEKAQGSLLWVSVDNNHGIESASWHKKLMVAGRRWEEIHRFYWHVQCRKYGTLPSGHPGEDD